jgi:TfoX/Sxy family transcriptional regulator of competence genes
MPSCDPRLAWSSSFVRLPQADPVPDGGPVTENERVPFDEDLAVRIRELVRGEAGVSEKRMFGGLAFLVGGNMAISASGQGGVLVRVEPAKSLELAARPHAQVAVMRGREMPGWLRVDPDGVRTRPQLQRWVDEGIAFARSLPGKPSDSR